MHAVCNNILFLAEDYVECKAGESKCYAKDIQQSEHHCDRCTDCCYDRYWQAILWNETYIHVMHTTYSTACDLIYRE